MSTIRTLAHQGGWDETLMIVGPLLAIIGLIALAKRKMNKDKDRPDETAEGPVGTEKREADALPSA